MRHDDDLIHIDDIASVTIEKPFIQIRDQIMKTSIDNQFTARHSRKMNHDPAQIFLHIYYVLRGNLIGNTVLFHYDVKKKKKDLLA